MSIFTARNRDYRRRRALVIMAAYSLGSVALVWWIDTRAHQPLTVWIGLSAIHGALGFAVGRWWVLLLPFILVAVSFSAGGMPDESGPEWPIWFYLALGSGVLSLPALVVGVGVRKLLTSALRSS